MVGEIDVPVNHGPHANDRRPWRPVVADGN
jgi:hypothetical protein